MFGMIFVTTNMAKKSINMKKIVVIMCGVLALTLTAC